MVIKLVRTVEHNISSYRLLNANVLVRGLPMLTLLNGNRFIVLPIMLF